MKNRGRRKAHKLEIRLTFEKPVSKREAVALAREALIGTHSALYVAPDSFNSEHLDIQVRGVSRSATAREAARNAR